MKVSDLKDMDQTQLLLEAMRLREIVAQYERDKIVMRSAINNVSKYLQIEAM